MEEVFKEKNKSSAIHQYFFQKFGVFGTEKRNLTNHVYTANVKLFFCFLFLGGGVGYQLFFHTLSCCHFNYALFL